MAEMMCVLPGGIIVSVLHQDRVDKKAAGYNKQQAAVQDVFLCLLIKLQ